MNNRQIREHIAQFMRIFANLQVETKVDRDNDGDLDTKKVAVYYGDMDRVVARLMKGENDWTLHSLPAMSVNLENVELDPERRLAPRHREATVVQTGDGKVAKNRLMSVPVKLRMNATLVCANNDQAFQIVETLLLMFSKPLDVNVSDDAFNWGHISSINMDTTQKSSTFPIGTEARYPQWDFGFSVDGWLAYPQKEVTKLIERVEASFFPDMEPVEIHDEYLSAHELPEVEGGGQSIVGVTRDA